MQLDALHEQAGSFDQDRQRFLLQGVVPLVLPQSQVRQAQVELGELDVDAVFLLYSFENIGGALLLGLGLGDDLFLLAQQIGMGGTVEMDHIVAFLDKGAFVDDPLDDRGMGVLANRAHPANHVGRFNRLNAAAFDNRFRHGSARCRREVLVLVHDLGEQLHALGRFELEQIIEPLGRIAGARKWGGRRENKDRRSCRDALQTGHDRPPFRQGGEGGDERARPIWMLNLSAVNDRHARNSAEIAEDAQAA